MKQRKSADKTQVLRDNKGSAIVMVLVIIAFISILVSVLCYRAILNYQMKVVDYKSKDNFYTAESALEEVRTGLQSIASNAVTESYVEVMQSYHDYSNQERANQFSYLYMLKLVDALKDGGDDEKYDVDLLKAYLTQPVNPSGVGAKLEATGGANNMLPYTEALILENVKITYTDDKGFVSIIETDIQMNLPAIDFNEAFRMPDILDYCIIANNSMIFNGGNTSIKGSVYAGKNGINLKGASTLNIDEAELVVTDGTINIESGSTLNVNSVDSNTWAKDIALTSAKATINGNTYIADDTTINGKLSKLTYKGSYYGFGETDPAKGSDGSSSILINGLGTVIDFSGLTTLTLAGNAYINIMDKGNMVLDVGLATEAELVEPDPASGLDSPFNTSHNILMGESLSVKSNQLAYLVPAECIGYIDGECVLGSNPVTQARLTTEFMEPRALAAEADKAKYVEVNMEMISSLGASLNSFNAKIQKLYRIESADTTLVYYYIVFENQADANYFFQQYYANNKTKMDSYIKNYIDITNSNFGNFGTMNVNLAGNLLRKEGAGDNATYILEEDSLAASTADPEYVNNLAYYGETYQALCTKLVKDYSTLSSEEIFNKGDSGEGLFANIIDMKAFTVGESKFIPNEFFVGTDVSVALYGTATDDYHAVVVKNPSYPYVINNTVDSKIRVVVATGDVQVKRNFNGIIIAKGDIIVDTAVSIENDDVAVSKAMQLTRTDASGNVHSYIDLFKDGRALAVSSTVGSGGSSDHVEVEALVGYKNWNKQ